MTDEINLQLILNLRKTLHENPESSMREIKTKKILMDFIREHTQNLEIVDRGAWFYVQKGAKAEASEDNLTEKNELKSERTEKSPIAFRADFDAVTCADGCARHLCGHDGHSAVLAGFALWLDMADTDRDVYLIFQPGEESGQGAAICSSLIDEKHIGEIYGFHNIPGYEKGEVILPKDSFACASTGMEIIITGKQSHAAYPENGVNPAGIIVGILQEMDKYLAEKYRGIVLGTVIGIEVGSRSYGVAAGDGVLRLTLRAQFQDEYDALIAHIENTARKLSQDADATCSISRIEEFPATVNDKTCTDRIIGVAGKLNTKTVCPEEPFRWSEDFGYYLQKTKGAFMGIGCGVDHPGLHTDEYEFEDNIIMQVIEIYSSLV